jgi:2-deoxy-D-gluconate 3-dehydrogenase
MILDHFRLDNQVAVITGGNRGLGLGIATALAQAGADIVSVQRSDDTAALTDAVESAGRSLLPVSLDIAQEGAAKRVLDATLTRFGRANILVNNAAAQKRNPAHVFPMADFDEVIAVDVRAVFAFCQTFGAYMLAQGRGKIINVASLLSFQGGITVPAYAAAKHAVAGLTKALCNEWAGKGVNVNAIAPGYMETDMNAALIADAQRNQAISARIPAGRWGQAEDLAGVAVFLASRASDYVHGTVVVVDGGWLAR